MSKAIFICASILLVAVATFIVTAELTPPAATPSPSISSSPSGESSTLTGTLECLPHKNTDGPITLECAYGLKTNTGDYYALDTTLFPSSIAHLPTGTQVTVTGKVIPANQVNPQLQKYAINGSILLFTIEED